MERDIHIINEEEKIIDVEGVESGKNSDNVCDLFIKSVESTNSNSINNSAEEIKSDHPPLKNAADCGEIANTVSDEKVLIAECTQDSVMNGLKEINTSNIVNEVVTDCLNSVSETIKIDLQTIQNVKESITYDNEELQRNKTEKIPEVDVLKPVNNEYRCDSDSWSDDEDSSSTGSDSSSDSDSFFNRMHEISGPVTFPIVKTKGELDLDDLPPIEDLVISVSQDDMLKIGRVHAIVEKLVVIRALKDMKPLDIDSVLFLSHNQPVGRIFDVFGPVVEPFYSIRFNSSEHIHEKGIHIDADIFFAPDKNDITSYVFIEDLQNQKGSDASWKHNNEPPEEFLDYSDDEQERAARRKRSTKNRNHQVLDNAVAAKRVSLSGDSGGSNHAHLPRSFFHRTNIRGSPIRFSRHNPFSSPLPPPSPTSSACSLVPIRVRNSVRFSQTRQPQFQVPVRPSQPPLPFEHEGMLRRSSSSPLLLASYQPPHIFGQIPMIGPFSPALHATPPLHSPALIPSAHLSPASPQNYFNQRFPRSPSPALNVGPVSPDPWLPNRAPISLGSVPPDTPLSVQIPHNLNNPSHPLHLETNSSAQPFLNSQNINLPPPFVNQQNMNLPQPFMNHENVNFHQPFISQNVNLSAGNVHPRFF